MGRITVLTDGDLIQWRKSPASTRAVIKNVSGLIQFPLDSQGESNPDGITLAGESSVALLRDYLESVDDRGRDVPGAVKTSLTPRTAALVVPWPIGNPLARAAAQVESSQIPKHDPPTKRDTFNELDSLALNVEISPFKRAFAPRILSMTYTSLRFSDAQRLRSLEANEGSAHGTLIRSKTKKPHGLLRPCACPRMGVSGSAEWVAPLIEFHVAREKLNGPMPSFGFSGLIGGGGSRRMNRPLMRPLVGS